MLKIEDSVPGWPIIQDSDLSGLDTQPIIPLREWDQAESGTAIGDFYHVSRPEEAGFSYQTNQGESRAEISQWIQTQILKVEIGVLGSD